MYTFLNFSRFWRKKCKNVEIHLFAGPKYTTVVPFDSILQLDSPEMQAEQVSSNVGQSVMRKQIDKSAANVNHLQFGKLRQVFKHFSFELERKQNFG